MKITILGTIKYLLSIGSVILAFVLFYPRTYDVPLTKDRKGVLYWDLSTGSRIAFTFIPAKGTKKPYPILFLQGGPGGSITDRTIESLVPLSENGYDLYFYDQVGGGLSERLVNIKEYTADRHRRDLEEIVKLLAVPKVILIAQSWGAVLATLYMAENPGKVAKVVFTSPGPVQPQNKKLAYLVSPDSLQLKAPVYSNADANEEAQNLRSKLIYRCAVMFGYKLASDKEADNFQTYLDDKLNKSTVCDTANALKPEGGGGYYAQIMTIKSLNTLADPRPMLKKSETAVLVLKGQCDNQKWGFTNEYLQDFKNHRFVVIPNAGHSISIEQPGRYIEAIRAFLSE